MNGRPLLERLNCAGAGGHNCRDPTRQRFADDQAVRLDPGREYEQVRRVPFAVQRLAGEEAGHCDPLPQPGGDDLGAQPSGVIRIGLIGTDQGGCPGQVGELSQCLDEAELIFRGSQRGEGEDTWQAGVLTALRHGCWSNPGNRDANVATSVSTAGLGGRPIARAQDPRRHLHSPSLERDVAVALAWLKAEFVADRQVQHDDDQVASADSGGKNIGRTASHDPVDQ